MEFLYITNVPELARHAEVSGVNRIMVDLEHLGKEERQRGLNTVKSTHTLEDVASVRSVLGTSRLQVRVNPLHAGSPQEIDGAIDRGADILMLPMFTTAQEVASFVAMIGGRSRACLLLETPQALVRIDEILRVEGVDEIHVGLNDLHLALGLEFMFELLSGGVVEYLADKVASTGRQFGFGGIARLGEGALDSRLVLSEHVRLGSSMAILSRGFHGGATSVGELRAKLDLEEEVRKVRSYLAWVSQVPEAGLLQHREQLVKAVASMVRGGQQMPRPPRNPDRLPST